MNKTNFILIKIVLAFVTTSYAQGNNIKKEYYRHLIFRETPYSDTRGNHPIDNATAQKEAHYLFVYDEQDRLIEVSHRLGDALIADNGNWDSFIWFSPKMTIEYQANQEIRHYYDHLNKPIEAHGAMYKAVFLINKKGKRTEVKFYNKDNQPSENAWGIHTYQWEHLKDGTVIEKRFDLKGAPKTIRPNFTFYTVRLEFGTDDLLDFMYHLNDEGKIINNTMKAGMDRIVYDQEENFSRWMVFDKNLQPVEGNAPEFAIGEHLYDCRGNKVELRGFDVAGKNKAMPNGVARTINAYDQFNNQIEVKNYDLEGNLLLHAKREFSADGRRVEWLKFYDSNGNITLHPNGQFAALKFEYHDDGSLAAQIPFDKDLQKINNQ
ncbi:hypothetical protein [Aureispira sp. CCB-E]|uniref:hypothetical protein n=1 Tax=Aureispira sp. CCB-E TaxID=3051121 RepID=UPI0028692AEE|nr:hypothetical protein [Aureispira sp. CCB-E]WMX12354.1 hypothetical protein QP953_16110 [Aureispira sp. CCB-E]